MNKNLRNKPSLKSLYDPLAIMNKLKKQHSVKFDNDGNEEEES